MTNQNPGAIVRQDFSGSQIQAVAETSALAVAAQAKAAVEARWLVATHQPRNLESVRQDLLRECQRPSFAEGAIYKKPVGNDKTIDGLSVRFVEQALQAMGNVDSESVTIYDDESKRIVEVRVTDFERNVSHRKQITISKTVERKYLRKGQVPISQRTNSAGKTTYLVHASEDDLLNKEGALISKAIRTCGLRIVPGWLQEECEQIIRKTRANEAARDPDAERRKLLDAFGQLGVMPPDLEDYLGHPISQVVPAELVLLREIYTAIRDGEATWVDTLAQHKAMRGEEQGEEPAQPSAAKTGAQAVKDALGKRTAPPAPPQAPPPPPSPQEPAKTPAPEEARQRAQEKLDAERERAKEAHAQKVERNMNAQAEQAQAKRPSRSKAAQAERAKEIEPWVAKGANDKVVRVYIENGDPRNLEKAKAIHAKAQAAAQDQAAQQAHPSPPSDEQIAEAFQEEAAEHDRATETMEDGTVFDAETGEVLEDEEPEWMREGPPPGEGF